jgi:hypothetical protein
MKYRLVTGGKRKALAQSDTEADFLDKVRALPDLRLAGKWVEVRHLDFALRHWPAKGWIAARCVP